MNATREYAGLPPLEPGLIYSYVGNGAATLVRRALGDSASEELVRDALVYFLKFYRTHALQHTVLYPGIRELIERLFAGGHTLTILTNKPVRISFDIISALGLAGHFARVYGGDSFPAKKPDPVGVRTLLEETRTHPGECLLIGDSGVDVQTARNAAVRCCGVRWGFQPEAFRTNPPDFLIDNPTQLLEFAVTG